MDQRANHDGVEHDDAAHVTDEPNPSHAPTDATAPDEAAPDEPTEFEPAEVAGPDDVVANARRRYGGVGAVLAASMLAIDNLLREKQKPDSVQIQEAASEPIDLDEHGIQMIIDPTTSVTAPPQARRAPVISNARRRRR